MTQWPKDTQSARNAFYGDPGKGEIAGQMIPVVPPFAMYYDGKRIKSISFHEKAAPALLAALNEIWDFCQHDQAKVDASGASKYFGAYNPRMVRGSTTKWSNHAYAAAIDLNALENAMYAKGNMPDFIVDAFCRQGWMWGGWYTQRKDAMHFEAVDNGGRKPKSARPIWPPVAHLFDQPVAEEFEPTADGPVDEPAEVAGADKTVIAARATAGAVAATPVIGTAAQSLLGSTSDIADQVTTVADQSGHVIAATKQVISVAKPGFWNTLLHVVTSPTFLIGTIVVIAAAWAFVWFWQRTHTKVN
jgi:hypothetical protein